VNNSGVFKRWAIVCFLLLGVTAGVQATVTFEAYQTDTGTSLYRSALDGSDPSDIEDPPAPNFLHLGSPNVIVSPRFSVAGATATLVYVRGYVDPTGIWTTQGYQEIGITASGTLTIGSTSPGTDRFLSSAGSSTGRILVRGVSSGTVDLFVTRTIQ